jgi:hypothetical protein
LIEQFAEIHDGWNGAGSVAPRAASVNAARTFLESIPPGVALPTPMITELGEMEFYWSLPTGYADISFDAEGIGSLFIRQGAGPLACMTRQRKAITATATSSSCCRENRLGAACVVDSTI